jgi:hypothetical protein
MTGRASEYTPERADEICRRLIEGESLRSICRDKNMPHAATVCRWLADKRYADFREQYALAREMQADMLADETLEIADDARNDWMEREGKDDAGWQANGENIQRSRLRVDQRKWYAGKLAPKKYGDKIELEHTGNGAKVLPTIPTAEEWAKQHGETAD